jgi:hypothetical protein
MAPALASLLLCYSVTKQDIEEHFSSHGSGKITEIKLMNGFGFIEYEDAMDARDVVPGKIVLSSPTFTLDRITSLTIPHLAFRKFDKADD